MKHKEYRYALVAVIVVTVLVILLAWPADSQKYNFEATVTAVDGNTVTADVTADSARLFSRSLGDVMVFDILDHPPVQPGDRISGMYLNISVDGDYVGLVSYVVLD